MYNIDLHLKMYRLREEFIPALEYKEIFDFCSTELSDQKEVDEKFEWQEKMKAVENSKKQWQFVGYTTKSDINKALRQTNSEIDGWMEKKRSFVGEMDKIWCDIHIEECLEKKEKLKKRLQYVSTHKIFKGDDKEKAKEVPIENYLEFKGGFTRCLWHDEKTGSLHKLPDKNAVWCFSCNKRFDVIDVVMKLNSVDFNKAVKIILGK